MREINSLINSIVDPNQVDSENFGNLYPDPEIMNLDLDREYDIDPNHKKKGHSNIFKLDIKSPITLLTVPALHIDSSVYHYVQLL